MNIKKITFPTKIFLFLLFSLVSSISIAEGTYQEPVDFVKESFSPSTPPKSSVLWITNKLKPSIYKIMRHKLNALRIRYWKKDGQTVWVLNEIGKEHPITVGLVIKNKKIQRIKVLIFRESRGAEVRHPFFINQFKQVTITPDNKLEKHIDSISGATLSVTALKKLARLALYFDKVINE